jgi:hypothetical protein
LVCVDEYRSSLTAYFSDAAPTKEYRACRCDFGVLQAHFGVIEESNYQVSWVAAWSSMQYVD